MEEIVIRKSIVKWKKKTTKDNTFNLYFIKKKKTNCIRYRRKKQTYQNPYDNLYE